MAMTPDGQRKAIADLLKTLPKMGRVHEYRRVLRDEEAVRKLLCPAGSDKVNGWMIYPAAASSTVSERNPGHHGRGVPGGGNVLTTFQWQIDAYYYIDDTLGTERVFFDLAWSVADTFNSYGLLDIDGITHQLPADVEQFGYVMLGNFALYHYARISVGFRGRTRPV